MSSQMIRQRIKSLGAMPSADTVAGLQKQLAQLEQPQVLVESEPSVAGVVPALPAEA